MFPSGPEMSIAVSALRAIRSRPLRILAESGKATEWANWTLSRAEDHRDLRAVSRADVTAAVDVAVEARACKKRR